MSTYSPMDTDRRVADFRRSAEVAAEPIARLRASVGARILGAIEATRAAVGQNTNLGIVLLCAPLARAAELRAARMQEAVAGVLAKLDVDGRRSRLSRDRARRARRPRTRRAP